MRRNICTKIYLVLLLIGLGACNDELVNMTPDSDLTNADFFKTSSDLDLAVIGVYSSLQVRKPTDYLLLELPTDNLYRSTYTSAAGANEVDNMAITPENPLFALFWENTYYGIVRANTVLANIEVPTDYKAGQKEQLAGEAKFMRALFYFDLVRLYGDVPKITSLLSAEEAKVATRTPAEEVYTLIIADLKEAIEQLPLQANTAKGRATKGAAAALLGKVYVYRKDWANAKTYLDLVPAFGHRLLPNFASLWKLENEDNNEFIFTMKYTDGTNGHRLTSDFLPFGGKTGISSAGLEGVFPSWDLHKLYEPGDTRKAATINEYYKAPTPANAPTIWFPHVNKFEVKQTNQASGIDLPVLRYADMVLLLAETYFGLKQPDLALQELNKVRARAFGDNSHNYTLADIATPESFLEKLLLERRLELAFENERWFDLVRTDRVVQELSQEERGYNFDTKTPLRVTLQPKPHYKFFPVPLRQIQRVSPGALSQNDGYN
ncbi:RagB/SusD family nutrient uptake outer membrane protein [Adhaeribacter aerolatus]|nr:RagB/SusD family nutrient uptake outer membrane protein [Adhaeribacter aerolatus]